MLTRLEVDGFKNLLGFSAEFGPFTCIAGANAVGKSNLFDAIEFLSLLADYDVDEAAARLRGGSEDADARSLFTRTLGDVGSRMKLAIEMVVPPSGEGAFGDAIIPSNFLRYELTLLRQSPRNGELLGQIVAHERLGVIPGDDPLAGRLRFTQSPQTLLEFRHGNQTISGWQHASPSPLGTLWLRYEKTLSGVRRELQSWRRLALEPSAMRKPDRFKAPQRLAVDGSHLAATLYRITHQNGTEPEDAYAELASRVSELTPIHDIRIDRDDKRELLTLEAELRQTGWVDARSLSEGTLRFLALASLALDPDAPRLVCIEEPENGIHPAVVGPLAELLRTTAHAPERQIIVNTHSPVFVQHVHAHAHEDLVMAKLVGMTSPDGQPTRALRLQPLVDTWRCHDDVRGVGLSALLDYLEISKREGG